MRDPTVGAVATATVFLLSLSTSITLAFAENIDPPVEMVITPNRVPVPANEAAGSVTVITKEEIEARGVRNVADALRIVPGLDIVQNGSFGGNTFAFIRGANSEHTLVLIDGVEANNPISTNRAFNFSDLTTDNIDRIEILRGPQSPLYGGDAMGGVIQIFTHVPTEKREGSVTVEAGSHDTLTERASFGGKEGNVTVSGAASREDSGGISAADSRDGNTERDGYENSTGSIRAEVLLPDDNALRLFARGSRGKADLDNNGGANADDPNRKLTQDQMFTRGELGTSLFDGIVKQIWAVSYSEQSFDDNNDPDTEHPLDSQRSSYQGSLLKLSLQNDIKLSDWAALLIGAETKGERGSSALDLQSAFGPFQDNFGPVHARINGYFTELRLKPVEYFVTDIGARVDDHSQFGSKVTWRVAPSLILKEAEARIYGSVGTGFKAPSLYQLYSNFGNRELRPEESVGWEVGVSKAVEKGEVTLAFFKNKFDNLITFNPDTFIVENIAKAKTQGVELTARYPVFENLDFITALTYMDTKDEVADASLLRRPRKKGSIGLQYQPTDRLKLFGEVIATGTRADNDFNTYPATRTTLSGYGVVNLKASYKIVDNVELFARVENLFDKNYQEVLGFGTRGLGGYAGVNCKW